MTSTTNEINATERHQILFGWNKTHSAYNKHQIFAELFEEQVDQHPQQIALTYKDTSLTYLELNHKANQFAHYLRELGILNNGLVAVCLEPTPDLLVCILGILKAGGAYVPLDPDNPIERQKLILADTDATVLITQEHLIHHFQTFDKSMILVDSHKNIIALYPIENPITINQASDLAYVIYTSGSTGKPKGVMICHQNLNHFVHWFSKALKCTTNDIFDFSSSISFDFSVATTLFPLLIGARIAICPKSERRDPYLYLQHLTTAQASVIKITPSHFRQIKDIVLKEKRQLELKYVIFGGETLFVTDIKEWLLYFPMQTMFCEYGPTEATVATSWIKVTHANINDFRKKIPIGKPALNTQLYVLNETLEPVTLGRIGELYIGGDGIAKGYLNKAEETEKKFINNPFSEKNTKLYKSGDFCRYLPNGNIEFVERADHQVKIRGFRIEIEEIENSLVNHPDIKAAIVTVHQIPKKMTEKHLAAYCVMHPEKKLEPQQIRQYLQEYLPDYMIPSFFETIEKMPLAASGKVDKQQLPAPSLTAREDHVSPQTEMENQLHQIWCQILHRDQISVECNFFDLGGDSLMAATIIAKIHRTLKKDITLRDIYDFPTIKTLAELTEQANDIAVQTQNNLDRIKIKRKLPLSELQFLFWLMRLVYPKANILNVVERKQFKPHLNISRLNFAVACICKKYPVLSYHVAKFKPIQVQQSLAPFETELIDFKSLKPNMQESKLTENLFKLAKKDWRKGEYSFSIHLFSLDESRCELQIALSHFISDEVSIGILLAELSKYYLTDQQKVMDKLTPPTHQYKDWIVHEKFLYAQSLETNIAFWTDYLGDVSPIHFPTQYHSVSPHTLYIPISEDLIEQLQYTCMKNRLNISDYLCAVIGRTLGAQLRDAKQILLNFVKSTRDNDLYEKSLGLFVRSDILKLDISNNTTLLALAKTIQRTKAELLEFQTCPSIVKMACLLKPHWEHKKWRNHLADLFVKLLMPLLQRYHLDPRALLMFFKVSMSESKKQFFIDVNMMNGFMTKNEDSDLFGCWAIPVEMPQWEVTVDTNILNIWFDRDGKNNPVLVLSAYLQNDFLRLLGDQLINNLDQSNHQNFNTIL